jgi:PhnB protein
MSTVNSIPAGLRTVTPHLVCANAAEAIEFYKKAFGAVEVARVPGPNGKIMHAQIRIGDSPVFLVDAFPEWGSHGPEALESSPVTMHLYVADADATAAQAVKAGAKVTMPVDEQFWGDRYGCLRDPFGHSWAVATHVRDVSREEMAEAMRKMSEKAPA